MSGLTPLPDGLGRNACWRVEWRVPVEGDGPLLLLARDIRGSQAAQRLALTVGERAWAGEFRLSARLVRPVITNLVQLRRWDAAATCPPPAPRALWALDLRDGRAVGEFLHALREAVRRASAAGVLAMADGLALVRIASTLTAC
ncbi:MAG TPA: hypothetical protein VGC35_05970 [Allosphingosinicella sp.]